MSMRMKATSAILGAVTLSPFEAIRIRTVAQPDYAPNFSGVVQRIIKVDVSCSY
jgi:hypothetical protein